jgi:hypothetical protein
MGVPVTPGYERYYINSNAGCVIAILSLYRRKKNNTSMTPGDRSPESLIIRYPQRSPPRSSTSPGVRDTFAAPHWLHLINNTKRPVYALRLDRAPTCYGHQITQQIKTPEPCNLASTPIQISVDMTIHFKPTKQQASRYPKMPIQTRCGIYSTFVIRKTTADLSQVTCGLCLNCIHPKKKKSNC